MQLLFCFNLSSTRLCSTVIPGYKNIYIIFTIMCILPFADRSGFCAPLSIQSDLILFKLPCCAGGKWGSDPFPSANEKLQSTHGCHSLSCLPQQISVTVRVWMIRPVYFHVKKILIIQLGPKPIVIQLLSIRMSLLKQSVNDSKIELARGTNRPSLKLIRGRITSLIKTCPLHVCWWYVVSLSHEYGKYRQHFIASLNQGAIRLFPDGVLQNNLHIYTFSHLHYITTTN